MDLVAELELFFNEHVLLHPVSIIITETLRHHFRLPESRLAILENGVGERLPEGVSGFQFDTITGEAILRVVKGHRTVELEVDGIGHLYSKERKLIGPSLEVERQMRQSKMESDSSKSLDDLIDEALS